MEVTITGINIQQDRFSVGVKVKATPEAEGLDEIKVFEPKAEILLDCIDETRSIKVCWIKGD